MIMKLTFKSPPNIFNYIQVRTLSWPYHGMNVVLHFIVSYDTDSMYWGIVILVYVVSIREMTDYNWP